MKIINVSTSILALAVLFMATALAQAPKGISPADRNAIQELASDYARCLAECRAESFADLFVPETGYFAIEHRSASE